MLDEIQTEEEDKLITVQVDNFQNVLVRLNLNDELSNIRLKLKDNSKIKMNNAISFAKKNESNNSFAQVSREDENRRKLKDIIANNEGGDVFLYLKSKPDWVFLKYKLKLEYGRSVTLEKANKKAFTISDSDIENNEQKHVFGAEGYRTRSETKNFIKDYTKKRDFILAADADIQRLANLGVSIENSNSNVSQVKSNSSYTVIEYSKESLELESTQLTPTDEFIKAVDNVIKSRDPRKFKEVVNQFGQLIPTRVTLGGMAYFKESTIARENIEEMDNELSAAAGAGLTGKARYSARESSRKNYTSKHEDFRMIGGKPSSNGFDETDWKQSLEDYRNWDCIKIQNPISIFQPLSKEKRKEILELVGKKILYVSNEDYNYDLSSRFEKFKIFDLRNIPENILDILRNKDADCNVFASVVDKEGARNDIFNCQILQQPNNDPRLIIHCIQEEFREREYKLRVMLTIVGYDINFNFNRPDFSIQLEVKNYDFNTLNKKSHIKNLGYDSSVLCFGIPVLDNSNNSPAIGHHFFDARNGNASSASSSSSIIPSQSSINAQPDDQQTLLQKIWLHTFAYDLGRNNYVNLPKFTFSVLAVPNLNHSDYFGLSSLDRSKTIKDILKMLKIYFGFSSLEPKCISLYSMEENNYDHIFLKQKGINGAKMKCMPICNLADCDCSKGEKLKKSEYNFAYFNPSQDKELMSYFSKLNESRQRSGLTV